MIKGCLRNVIVVKDTGSDLFEEAYFIVSAKGGRENCDLLCEAKKIIARKAGNCGRERTRRISLPSILFGFLFGAVFSAGIFLLFFI